MEKGDMRASGRAGGRAGGLREQGGEGVFDQ